MKIKPSITVCLNCGRKLKPVIDKKTNKISEYLFNCKCMPNIIISIG